MPWGLLMASRRVWWICDGGRCWAGPVIDADYDRKRRPLIRVSAWVLASAWRKGEGRCASGMQAWRTGS